MKREEIEPYWIKLIADKLVGKKIVKIEYMSAFEAEDTGWYARPVVIVLDDGSYLMPMCDDEGNDGGALATGYKDLNTIPVLSVEAEYNKK